MANNDSCDNELEGQDRMQEIQALLLRLIRLVAADVVAQLKRRAADRPSEKTKLERKESSP
jgi:hypothetical protein